MPLFGGKSLVDAVDEIIDLVNDWNVKHCASFKFKLQNASKKRSHPSSALDSITSTPAKKSKLNATSANNDKNCLVNLEQEAREKFVNLTLEAIKSVYNIDFNAEKKMIFTQLSRPNHGRGHITLPCFKFSKMLKKKPQIIAEELSECISKFIQTNVGVLFLSNPFLKVEAANGRINAYLTATYLAQIISLILCKENCFLSPLPFNGSRCMVEYSQPNTHKAFHVGHMRNVALGDCVIRLFTHCGYEVVAANYFGDEGAHVAKCCWLLQKEIDEGKLNLDDIEKNVANKGEWLGAKYAESVSKLTLSTYTKFPFEGVIVAKVVSKEKHPKNEKWHVVKVEYKIDGKVKESVVVCGGTDYEIGNFVAYICVGGMYKGKVAEAKDMKGVVSEGVIMGALELGVKLPPIESKNDKVNEEEKESNNSETKPSKKKKKVKKKKKKKVTVKDQRIYLVDAFYPNAKIGDKLTEIGKYDQKIGDVVDLWKSYVSEQQNVLKLIESGNKKYVSLWKRTSKWSLDEFRSIYNWLGARFDTEFFESDCSESSRKLVDEYYEKGIFIKSDGAIGCDLNDKKLGFCMLLKSNGSGLYATKDLSLAQQKFEKFKIDRSIYVVDSAQSHHFKQVFATLDKMGYEQASKCYHLSYAFVRLPEGKMGSRTGNVILFSELVKMLKEEINEQFLSKLKDDQAWTQKELDEAERAISVGTIRYGMLNHDNNKEIIFDLKKWALSSGNTGPYLMYQYARISSIGKKIAYPTNVDLDKLDYSVLESNEIAKTLLFELSQFQAKIKIICEDTLPSQLCDYLYSICNLFSKWYCIKENSIKNCEDPHLKAVRLRFVEAVAKTIKTGIELLGITPLDRM